MKGAKSERNGRTAVVKVKLVVGKYMKNKERKMEQQVRVGQLNSTGWMGVYIVAALGRYNMPYLFMYSFT